MRGPTIGAVTPSWCSSHASATAAGSSPSSRAVRLPLLELRASPSRSAAAPSGAGRVRRARHPAEHPAGERAPRDHAEAVAAARRQHFELDRARHQVVQALLAHQPEEVARAGGLVRLRDVPAGEVAAPDVDDLALLDERLHRLPHLVPRRGPVDVVHLVEVDVVGLQAAQAGVARGADVTRGEAAVVRPLRHRSVDLGGEHDLLASVAALREPVADDRLRRARALVAAVPVRGVEEVDAVIERLVHDHERVALRS